MITLHFDKLFNNDRLLEPCFVSLPFAKGTLTDASSISLLQNNQALPIQTKITSTYEDGSIRYLFVRFMADLPANRATDITCVLQPESVKHTLPLSYTETVDGFTVSNGELTFEVENHSLHLFRTLDAFGKHYDKECFIGPYLTNSRQISFQMSFDHWTIEEAGDICIVLSCKGQLLCENTSSLPCEVRLTVYAGKSWIDTSVRLINATKNTLEISSYAPFTSPAMSTISTVVGTIFVVLTIGASTARRSSGTVMTPTLGSMVQKGKFALCALALLRQLKRVDLPTFGSPTMPHLRLIGGRRLCFFQ